MSASITRIPTTDPTSRTARVKALGCAMTELLEGYQALGAAAEALGLPPGLLDAMERSVDALWEEIDRQLARAQA